MKKLMEIIIIINTFNEKDGLSLQSPDPEKKQNNKIGSTLFYSPVSH